MDEKESEVLGR